MKAIEEFLIEATKKYGSEAVITIDQSKQVLKEIKRAIGIGHLKQSGMVTGIGEYAQVKLKSVDISKKDIVKDVQMNAVVEKPAVQENMSVNLVMSSNIENLIPSKFEGFVPWGHTSTIKQVVKSGLFYPIFVTGLSGNGKTLMIEQIHADMKKELIRVNITIETDEDDLLGGFRLVNGETKFVPGPVIEAMQRGCTLLLDECDLGSNKLLALQPVLEGKGVYLKKVNQWVAPKKGFNVMATANTKGKGSEDGMFIGTNILNEAFLERFAITLEQPYPSIAIEKKIVVNSMKKYNKVDEKFADNLITWADVIRKTFYDGGIDEVISTRRLDHIAKAFAIFNDKAKSIELCVARFDADTKESFLDLYGKIDAGINPLEEVSEETKADEENPHKDENDF
jgi:MoxR-like ATPase